MKINDIRMPKGANKDPKRLGRGSGSKHGKTSGRGHKGAKARAGTALRPGFEGGQMPLIRRLPKVGFINPEKIAYQIVNIERLNHFKKDSSVDRSSLIQAGLIRSSRLPVKILGEGKLTKALHVSANAFSESAKKKIHEAGGKANVIKG